MLGTFFQKMHPLKSGLSRFPIPHDSRFIRITVHDSNDLSHDPRFEFQPDLNNLPSITNI